MKDLPEKLIASLQHTTGFDEAAFRAVHALGGHPSFAKAPEGRQITSIRVNPAKVPANFPILPLSDPYSKIPWTETGYYLTTRPSFTFDPLFHAGCYYVQEASSMFLEQALKQTADLSSPLKVLDLCASPGGKSTHIQSLLSAGSLLISNEVIRARANVLKDNIIKWGAGNVMVTNNDPADFARVENFFDVIVVDAPCSGSGLFRRDPDAIDEWSENNVQLCSQRQQRILADVWPALKKDGILIYSTCSYSYEEDEEIMDWISGQLAADNCILDINSEWGILQTISPLGNTGYRCWPDKVKGEGFFLACFIKREGGKDGYVRVKDKPEIATNKEMELITPWVITAGLQFIKYENTVYAWPEIWWEEMSRLLKHLRVIYSGIRAGELMRNKLVPDHALAMSNSIHPAVRKITLDYEQAILYLQRKDLVLENTETGWQLVMYGGLPLGWVNVLPNRVNNYYPKELRIVKEQR